MKNTSVEQRLRTFLLVLAGFMCIGTIVELFLAKHYDDPIQFVPFILCGIGFVAIALVLFHPRRATLIGLRVVMATLMIGSLVGMYEHIQSNLAFEMDIRPSAVASDVWFEALRGAAPLLAPGILALAGILAIAGTYYHPGLRRASATQPMRIAPNEASISEKRTS